MKKSNGYIALISVLILGAVILAITVTVLIQTNRQTEYARTNLFNEKAHFLADACAEYALMQLKNDKKYSGSETITVHNDKECDILSVTGSGNKDRTINVEAEVQNHPFKLEIIVSQVNPSMKIDDWNIITF